MSALRVLFVVNFCPHYRVKTYELLARRYPIEFLFYSGGEEAFWEKNSPLLSGKFHHEYLKSVHLLGNVHVTPSLVTKMLRSQFDVAVVSVNGRFALPAAWACARARGIPVVLWSGIWSHPTTWFHRLSRPILNALYRNSQAVVTYGSHVTRHLVQEGIPGEHIFTALHATDNDAYSAVVTPGEIASLRSRHGLGDARVVLYVGRLTESKGVNFLVDAMARLPNSRIRLLLLGTGDERAKLESRIRDLAIEERVVFGGYIANADLRPYYAMSHAFVLPSITTVGGKEPWGLVVNEAMNQGCPPVVTDAVGAAAGGLVRHGETGLVVPERDPAALAVALDDLLNQPERRDALGAAAARAVAGWNNERMVDAFQAAIEHAGASRSLGARPRW